VKNIIHSKINRTLVCNLTRLCRDLGILTIGEFVENQEIFQALQAMGVDYAQGFHLAVPVRQMA
jgi:EAL domain-containing protein (putative c-di-GMP-specific phosphodiesterase class I)